MFTKDPSGISKDLMKTYAYSSQMLWPSYSSTFLLQVKAEISQIYPGNQDFIPVWLADMYSPARPVWISKERKRKKKKACSILFLLLLKAHLDSLDLL